MPSARLRILKTSKLFIGGKFPRAESGRVLTAVDFLTGAHLAHYGQASIKDLRDAVAAARAAQRAWAAAAPSLRGQILYRAAEMIEGRMASLASVISTTTGVTAAAAEDEVAACADRLVHFAGWADKISAVFGSVNQVATSHFNFTVPEPTGVVAVLAPDRPSALGLIGAVAPVLDAGHTVVVVASDAFPLAAMELAEAFATSDLPAGVVNILTGKRAELVGTMASHLDINAVVDASDDPTHRTTLRLGAAGNLKRVHFRNATREAGTDILDTVEMKTVWHPVSW